MVEVVQRHVTARASVRECRHDWLNVGGGLPRADSGNHVLVESRH